jgi:hypothetical protein
MSAAAIWEMDGTNVIGSAVVGNPGPSWHAKGTGDFNGDGFRVAGMLVAIDDEQLHALRSALR